MVFNRFPKILSQIPNYCTELDHHLHWILHVDKALQIICLRENSIWHTIIQLESYRYAANVDTSLYFVPADKEDGGAWFDVCGHPQRGGGDRPGLPRLRYRHGRDQQGLCLHRLYYECQQCKFWSQTVFPLACTRVVPKLCRQVALFSS